MASCIALFFQHAPYGSETVSKQDAIKLKFMTQTPSHVVLEPLNLELHVVSEP